MKKKITAIFLSMVLLFTTNISIKADTIKVNDEISKEVIETEQKVFSKAAIDEDFADDSVIVVFKKSRGLCPHKPVKTHKNLRVDVGIDPYNW